MAATHSERERPLELKQGQYSDGSPLDEVQYLECKLILKPDRFTAAEWGRPTLPVPANTLLWLFIRGSRG